MDFLYVHLDVVMKIAVFIYMLAILTMATMAAQTRKGNANTSSFSIVMVGALLFVISDTLIAFNRFVAPIYLEGIFVMTTYIAAQYSIMQGILKEYR